MKLELFSARIFEFGVGIRYDLTTDYNARHSINQEVHNWCEQQFGSNFASDANCFYFNTEEDRNWFILRWS